ncbi:sugar-binding domain-containing protein [Microbacterium sp. X-17]|uniref:sugar-binding transcriptional regulator n=1 Tax=Microbacterium sp. X-17 TaxID=3144404 RepID=UPI0031F5131E
MGQDHETKTELPLRQAGTFSAALMYRAARLYYEDELSQLDVAERLQVSRSTVSRLLSMAKERGIVRVSLVEPSHTVSSSVELADLLHIRSTTIVDTEAARANARDETSEHLVDAALAELGRLDLKPGSVMGVSWGDAVRRISNARTEIDLSQVNLVPVIGGVDEADPRFQINEIVRQLSAHTGASATFLHVPAAVSLRFRASLLKEPSIADRLALWDRLDAALVGIGAMTDDPAKQPIPRTFRSIDRLSDAVGDVAANFYTTDGSPCASPDESLLAITREQLKRTPQVLAVASGARKARAIVGAARAGLITDLVTDHAAATAIFDYASR